MNYQQALKYLNSFINYEKVVPKSHAQFNLERMRHGLEALGHPDHDFFPILIAGTVGKGSTGYFLEQILLQSKISCGFYHSPHIDTIRERIRVGGEMLSEKEWSKAVGELQKTLKTIQNIEGRLIKAEKQKEEVTINQIKNIKEKLFPKGSLQERQDNLTLLFLLMGFDAIDLLMAKLNPLEQEFKIIEL